MQGVKHDWIIRETKPGGDIYVIRESAFDSGAKRAEVLCEREGKYEWVPVSKKAESEVAYFMLLGEACRALDTFFGDEPLCDQ